jgi:hypothetical protein
MRKRNPRHLIARREVLRRHLCDEFVAGLLTVPARLGADAAMLHAVLSVHLALVAAKSASGRARLESGRDQLRLERRLPRHDVTGGIAEVGTVEVEPDAARERFRVALSQTCISARRTGLRAVETGADAVQECVIGDDRLRMRLNHGVRETHWDFSSSWSHLLGAGGRAFATKLLSDRGQLINFPLLILDDALGDLPDLLVRRLLQRSL